MQPLQPHLEQTMIDDLKSQFDYVDGALVRKNGRHSGSKGTVTKAGYVSTVWNGKRYYAHRLIWLWFNGEWPDGVIDHIDRNPLNNKIENLRTATKSENAMNSSVTSAKSGVKGVRWYAPLRKYHARLMKDGKEVHIGYFSGINEAETALNTKRRELFGEFAWIR